MSFPGRLFFYYLIRLVVKVKIREVIIMMNFVRPPFIHLTSPYGPYPTFFERCLENYCLAEGPAVFADCAVWCVDSTDEAFSLRV